MILRPYQKACISAIFRYWQSGKTRGICVLPTGSGKSIIIADLIKQVLEMCPTTRIMVITDSQEIIKQDCEEIKKHIPDISIGIYSAGLKSKDRHKQVTLAGIQSVYLQVPNFYPPIDLVISDESHMISQKSETRYGTFFDHINTCNPSAEIIGFTASPYRLDQGLIYGTDCRFNGLIYNADISDLIKSGYLSPVISKGGLKQIDLTGIHTRGGEYVPDELASAASDPDVVRSAVSEIVAFGADRKSWLIFAAGVNHAHTIETELKKQGMKSCEVLTGDVEPARRDRILTDFKSGNLRCVINVAILIKGFNHPELDLIALLTATKSTSKYVQAVGRILRPAPGKENGLLLDFGGNVEYHGPIDDINPHHVNQGTGDAPMKQCPNCQALIYASVRECPQCGYTYPDQDFIVSHGTQAYDGAILTEQIQPEWVTVTDVYYSRHEKEGKPDSAKVVFFCGPATQYPLWLALEHGGYATTKAKQYIIAAGGTADTVDEILQNWKTWKRPRRVRIKKNGKFHDILSVDFQDEKQQKQMEIE